MVASRSDIHCSRSEEWSAPPLSESPSAAIAGCVRMSRFIVEQAKAHRRGGLKTATESFTGSTLYGWIVSPYTAKVRSMLAHKNIPFTDASPSALQLFGTIKSSVGRTIMPTMRLADGSWRQDSALICDEIEASHPEVPTRPPGATQRV